VKTRVISAAILIPVAVLLFVVGGWAYNLLIVVATSLAGYEFALLFRSKGYVISPSLVVLITLLVEVGAIWPGHAWSSSGLVIGMLVVSLWELALSRRFPQRQRPTEQWALTLAGGGYLGAGGAHLISLRAMPEGLWWLLTTCVIVWIGDSAAYFIGRRWGRHKMAPTISPGKSWEGYAAQVVGGTLGGWGVVGLLQSVFGPIATLTIWHGLLLGFVVSVLCPAGDFLISMMKRQVGVKDTSRLIPGHGGMLDRIDSLLWAGILGSVIAQFL
jgi:phosphatidate cytidylyltransferase